MDNPNLPLPGRNAGTSAGTGTMDRLRGLTDQIAYATAQPALRRALPAIGVALAAALALAAYLMLAPADRMVVQTGLPEAEKSRAMDALTAQGFAAMIDPATGALTVPSADYHRARMALASEGLPQAAPDGLAAIADMPMGASRSVENARLRRMMELDLAQTIAELEPVRAARVHLALPERSAFLREVEPPRASVVVQLGAASILTEAQTRAIVSLVAAAVPNMPAEAVSVVDQTGRLLSGNMQDEASLIGEGQLRQRLQVEDLYRNRILALVTPLVGVGNAAVEVTVDMDFTRSEVTAETFDPEATALRSEQGNQSQSAGTRAAGIPGAVANTPPPEAVLGNAAPAANQAGTVNDQSSAFTRNYEVSRRVETTQAQTGQILRVHAAVLLRATPTDPAAEDGASRDAGLIQNVEALTRSAIGFEAARGDQITVSTSPFVEAAPMPSLNWYDAPWLPDLARIIAQVTILALILLVVVRPLLSRALSQSGTAGHSFGAAVEVGAGESLRDIHSRLNNAPDADDLNGAISYEEKLSVLQQIGREDTGRIAQAFRSMMIQNTDEDSR